MALKKAQYESIMRDYDRLQNENRRAEQERLTTIRRQLPEYADLESASASVSAARARQLLEGDTSALEELKDSLRDIAARKRELLVSHGYPADYLDPICHCADCRDTGYIESSDGLRTKCHCLRNREIALLYEQSHIRELLAEENFSTLSYQYYQGEDLERFERAVGLCKNFVLKFKQDYHNLFFYGTVGTGKSFLSGCVAGELLKQGYTVIYFSAHGLFETLAQHSFGSRSKEALYDLYDDLYNCDLLIIDDLGTEITNSFVSSQLFACMNERNLRRNATVISTNLNLEELRDRYSERIFSRIIRQYDICKISGPDIRLLRKRGSA